MKKTTSILKVISSALIAIAFSFATPTFGQDPVIDNSKVEEVEEVEISDDSIVVSTPTDIALAPEEDEIPRIPGELIEDRLGCLEKDIKLTYNKTIHSF